MIQDFLCHGISIPIGTSNKFAKKLMKMLCQNFLIDQSATTIVDWSMPYGWACIDGKICNGNFITGPYWNDSYNLFSSKICFTLHFSVHQMVAYNIILELMVVFKLSILMEIDICVTKIIEFAFVKRRVSRKLFILKTK